MQIALVFFDNTIKTPEPRGENCYSNELAFATPFVQDIFNQEIEDITTTSFTADWIEAFKRAFNYLSGSRDRGIGLHVNVDMLRKSRFK